MTTAGRARRLLAWEPRPATGGRASVALGLLLLMVCGLAVGWTQQANRQIHRADRAARLADLYQDARAYAAREDAELNTYRLDGLPSARLAHQQAAQALSLTMQSIQQADGPSPGTAGSAARLVAQQNQYEMGAEQVITLLESGQTAAADSLQRSQVEPLRDAMGGDLDQQEESHHRTAVAALDIARRDGTLLKFGTPLALVLTLLLLLGLVVVSRANLRRARRESLHDPLTGLPNRLLFAARSQQTLDGARESDRTPVVMMLDLDRFKEVNDSLGHHCGDQLLRQVASRIAAALRPTDTVARLGGDEFAVLLPDGGQHTGSLVAARIVAALQGDFSLDGLSVGVEASIGIATAGLATNEGHVEGASPNVWPDAETLLRHADSAMYKAKANRTGYVHFTGGEDQTHHRLALLGELRTALERDELVVHYQPKVLLKNDALHGVEALVRWQHPARGLLSPAEFLDLAENTTLIHRLTAVVLAKSLRLARAWLDQGLHIPVAVNVSARSFLDTGFPASVRSALVTAGVPGELLCLELTESTIMTDPDAAIAAMHELRSIGIRLSLDDFGTGYSSMSYLKILPVDELKVDQSFVKDFIHNAHDAVLLESSIDLGHNLGLSVVAEGVEDNETLSALRALGADVVQGYHLARPMPEDRLLEWIAARQAGANAAH